MANILICDDEQDIVNALKIYLNDPDYVLFEAHNGKEAVETVRENEIHLVLLDIMMPVMNGIEAMSQIRGFSNVPIILLTAKSEDADKVLGLNVGADDYITKPFSPLEVCARVKSQLRRYLSLGAGATKTSVVLTIGGLELDYDARTVTLDWHEDPMGADNTVAVHIRHLREKTEINPAEPRYIKVVFGQGYKIQKGN